MTYILKVVLLHIIIAILYLGLIAYLFVTAKQPGPIAGGIRQVFFMVLHLLITVIVMYPYARQPQKVISKFVTHVIVVILIITVVILTSNLTWSWLWSLRS